MTTFSERLSAARREKQMTRDEFAQALGVSRKLVARWESDRAEPTPEQCEAICALLEIPMIQLKPTPPHKRVLTAVALAAFIAILLLAVYPIYKSRHSDEYANAPVTETVSPEAEAAAGE